MFLGSSSVKEGSSKSMPMEMLDSAISEMNAIDFKNWNEIKEHGFYVDFSGCIAIAPTKSVYKEENLKIVFIIIYLALKYIFKFSQGMDSQDPVISPENILFEFKDMIEEP